MSFCFKINNCSR